MARIIRNQGGISQVLNEDFHTCMFACFLSQEEPKRILVDLPQGKRAIGTKWVYRNKNNERGIVVRNKARLVAQGHIQEEGIDYEEVFAPVARIEAIRLFLAYASFMGFMVYQIDIKSAFLYGTIKEEVYVYKPPGFKDPDHPNRVYKVVKALYGLHQAPRAWYETLATYLLENGFQKGTIDQTLFIKKQQKDILLVQIYVDDIIFGATNKALCQSFEKLMKDKFQMSLIGELTFFLGLRVKQKKDGIFISQDKYVAEILRKFRLSERKSASTLIDAEKTLLKDSDGEDVDKQTFVATSSTEAKYVAAASGCAQVLWMQNQLLDYGDSPLLGVNTPRSDEDRLKLMELMVFMMKKGVCDEFGLNAARLSKFLLSGKYAAEGFAQIIDFLSGSYIHYALTVSPHIYISCIKQFWNSVSVKRSCDITRTSWNEFSTAMASAVICLSKGQRFNFSRVGKGFSGVETPLFKNMLAVRDVDAEEEVQVLDTCSTLARRIEGLEHDKVAQQLEIVKLKARVKKLEKLNKVKSSKLGRLQKVGTSQRVESSDDVENVFNQGRISVDIDEGIELVVDQEKDAEIEGRHADKQAEIYNIDLDHSSKVLSMQEDDTEVQEAVEIVTTAKLMTEVVTTAATQVAAASIPISAAKPKILTITVAPVVSTRKRKRVVIRDPEEELHTDTPAETPKVKDKGKGISIEDPKPMKKKDQVEMDAEYAKKLQEELDTENVENTEGLKMEFFKGKTYDEILPIFQARFDANLKFLFKSREEMEKEDEEIIKSINETPAQKAAKRRRLHEQAKEDEDLKKQLEVVVDEGDDVFIEATSIGRKVPVVNYEIMMINNKPRLGFYHNLKVLLTSFASFLANAICTRLEGEGIKLWMKGLNPKVKDVIEVNDDRHEDEDVELNSSDKVGRGHDHDSSKKEEVSDQDKVEKENGVRSSDDGVENESEKYDVEERKARRKLGLSFELGKKLGKKRTHALFKARVLTGFDILQFLLLFVSWYSTFHRQQQRRLPIVLQRSAGRPTY
nr:putative ribonuclease H-like domain-containing protein [Tanacetum cinerariifolium]